MCEMRVRDMRGVDRLSYDMLASNPKENLSDRETTAFPAGREKFVARQWRPSAQGVRGRFFILVRVWLSVITIRSFLQGHSRRCGEPKPHEHLKGEQMWPRSEKGPWPENQIRFTLDRFTFRRNIWLGYSLYRKEVRRPCNSSFQSYDLEFCADPLAVRQPSGLQIAYV